MTKDDKKYLLGTISHKDAALLNNVRGTLNSMRSGSGGRTWVITSPNELCLEVWSDRRMPEDEFYNRMNSVVKRMRSDPNLDITFIGQRAEDRASGGVEDKHYREQLEALKIQYEQTVKGYETKATDDAARIAKLQEETAGLGEELEAAARVREEALRRESRTQRENTTVKEQYSTLDAKAKRLEEENKKLRAGGLGQELEDTRKTNEHLSQQNASLSARVNANATEVEKLKADCRTLEDWIDEVLDDPRKTILGRLSRYADKLEQLAEQEDKDSYEIPCMSLKQTLQSLSELGINVSSRNPGEILAEIRSYIEGNGESTERLSGIIDAQMPAEATLYKQLKVEVEKIDSDISKMRRAEIDEETIKMVIEGKRLEEKRKAVAEYDGKRISTLNKLKQGLEICATEMAAISDQERFKAEVRQTIGEDPVPVYIETREDEQNMFLDIYLPVRAGKKSVLCDKIVTQNVLTEDTVGALDKGDEENITESAAAESNLQVCNLRLPKDRYSAERAREIRTKIENAIRAGYDNSLRNIGIGIELILRDTIMYPSAAGEIEERTEPMAEREAGEYRKKENSEKLYSAIRSVMAAGNPMSSVQVKREVEKILGIRLTYYQIKGRLDSLDRTGEIKTDGVNNAMTYVLVKKDDNLGQAQAAP